MKVKVLSVIQTYFRCIGLLPIDGKSFNKYKFLEYIRAIINFLPIILMSIGLIPFIYHIRTKNIGDGLFVILLFTEFLNSILIFVTIFQQRKHLLAFIESLQKTTDES